MSVKVCRTPTALFHKEKGAIDNFSAPNKIPNRNRDEERPDKSSMLNLIQSQKAAVPYVHPLVRRLSSFFTNSSLEMCTESLGSETGTGDVSDDDQNLLNCSSDEDVQVIVERKKLQPQHIARGEDDRNQLMSVSRRIPVLRSFPPPLSSISRCDGTSIQMRTSRHDGRLVLKAVPVSSQSCFHVRRHEGRLLLSFMDSVVTSQPAADKTTEEPLLNNEDQTVEQVTPPSKKINQSKEVAEDEDEDDEEVEVLDRGTMVEVKVSSQLKNPGGRKKILRSSIVINKFVGGTPLTNQNRWAAQTQENHSSDSLAVSQPPLSTQWRPTATSTITAAAAAVAASSASTSSEVVGQHKLDNKMLFSSKPRNREEMLHHMRRCSELRRPLFFWEVGCIATST